MVKIKNLYKTYNENPPIKALDNINITIPKGQIYGIIGRSGAGKSSLTRCINMLEKPDSGEIIINNLNITKVNKGLLRKSRKEIGIIFQQFNLLMNKTVFQNVAFPLSLSKNNKTILKEKVLKMLNLVDLSDKLNVYPSKLSGGQKQRVGIARALISNPSLLISDEATSALDPDTTKSILNLLKEINQKLGITIIIITHEMEVIKNICDRVAIISHGKIVEEGEAPNIYINPKTDIGRRFFHTSNVNILDEPYRTLTLSGEKILKLTFTGKESSKSHLSSLTNKYNLDISLLSSNIKTINNNLVGNTVLSIKINDAELNNIISHLKENNILAEVING